MKNTWEVDRSPEWFCLIIGTPNKTSRVNVYVIYALDVIDKSEVVGSTYTTVIGICGLSL